LNCLIPLALQLLRRHAPPSFTSHATIKNRIQKTQLITRLVNPSPDIRRLWHRRRLISAPPFIVGAEIFN
jgi:hypothetical protein